MVVVSIEMSRIDVQASLRFLETPGAGFVLRRAFIAITEAELPAVQAPSMRAQQSSLASVLSPRYVTLLSNV